MHERKWCRVAMRDIHAERTESMKYVRQAWGFKWLTSHPKVACKSQTISDAIKKCCPCPGMERIQLYRSLHALSIHSHSCLGLLSRYSIYVHTCIHITSTAHERGSDDIQVTSQLVIAVRVTTFSEWGTLPVSTICIPTSPCCREGTQPQKSTAIYLMNIQSLALEIRRA